MTPLLIRADATTRMGTGHVMRCLALAQAWQDAGGQVTFVVAELPPALRERLLAEHCAVESLTLEMGSPADAAETATLAERIGAEWVVLDGYHFRDDFQQSLKDAGLRVLAVDDYGHAGGYPADLVLNQNLGADERLYVERGPDTRLLLGPRYALLRREFTVATGWERTTPAVARKVLVTLGGADPDNVTLTAIEAIGRLRVDELETVVLVGVSNPHRASLENAVRQSSARIDLKVNVSDMSALMRWADIAVTAGGTTTWERAAVGLPALSMILADNQRHVVEACEEGWIGRNLGWHADVNLVELTRRLDELIHDSATRAEMASCCLKQVDSGGARRVIRAMTGPPMVRLRPATPDDARRVWEWANDSATRAASFTTAAIPWERHERWFAERLADPECELAIVEDGIGPIGQVRFDRTTAEEVVISVGLAPEARGRGYGSAVIRSAVDALFASRPVLRIVALIRPENQSSVRAFVSAGFAADGETTVLGNNALRYIFTR